MDFARNTEDAVVKLSELVTKSLDNSGRYLAIFLDFKKALHTVFIPLLLHKLEYFGIRETAPAWFRDYLTNISQVVKVSTSTSCSFPTTFGNPQGSTLSPTLFLAYVNNLYEFKLNEVAR